MRYLENIFFIFCFLFCVLSCGEDIVADRIMDRAEVTLETFPDSAFVALDSLDRSTLKTEQQKARYALLYSIALDKVGIKICNDSIINVAVGYYDGREQPEYEKALQYQKKVHQNAQNYSQLDTLARQHQKIIEERFSDKISLVQSETRRKVISSVLCASLALICLLAIIVLKIVRKLRNRPDEKAMAIIKERLSILDKILAAHISDNPTFDKMADKNIDNLISDRESFLDSCRVVISNTHPIFAKTLSEAGLTDWEIGYCCLYILGLKGKDVGEYIKKKRHYIIDHEIRQKLGLGEHDTNLSIYLRRLLEETEFKA